MTTGLSQITNLNYEASRAFENGYCVAQILEGKGMVKA